MKHLLVLLLFFCASVLTKAQNQFVIDSLLAEYNNAEEDTSRIHILKELSKQYFGSDLIVAIDYVAHALEIAIDTDNKLQIIKLYRAKGGILTYMGDYTESVKYFLKALKIAKEINNQEEIFPLYINLGAIHDNMNKHEQAKDSYLKALDVYNSLPEESKYKVNDKLGSLYNNLGNIYRINNDLKTAEIYYLKCYDIGVEQNDKKLQVFSLRNLGGVYLSKQSLTKAFEFENEALQIAITIEDKDEIAKCYQSLVPYYMIKKKYSKAIEIADSSYNLAKEIGALRTMQKATEYQYSIYEELGDFKKAYLAHKTYKYLSDSLINENTISKITRAELQYEYDIKEEANLAKQQERELIVIVFISSLLLILIIVVLLFILLSNRHKRIQLEKNVLVKEMDLRDKELATNVMYLVEKNEFINSVSKRLINLKSSLKDENKRPVQKIIYDIQSSIDKEIWEEFELRFQKVHSEFYNNLLEKFPELSMAERKLAAFLRLDMTSKDIAAITGQSVKSIEVARSRLRKKLGITNQEVNLVSFLLEV